MATNRNKNKLFFVLDLVVFLSMLNLVPLSVVFIHQVTMPVEAVNFFGIYVNGCFVYDLGIVILFIFLNFILIAYLLIRNEKRDEK